MTVRYTPLFLLILAATLFVPGGVGGGSALANGGIGGSGITVGTVSGVGGVSVNGVEFDASRAEIRVNDQPSPETALKVGMKVTVEGRTDADGKTGDAERITYDPDLRSIIQDDPVADASNPTLKSFFVLGTQVIAEDKQTVFDDITFALLAKGQLIEVSGFFDQVNAALRATRLAKKDGDQTMTRTQGVIAGLEQNAGVGSFSVRGTSVRFDRTTQLPPGGLREGLFVKIKGTLPDPVNSPDAIFADEIERRGMDVADDTEASVQGITNSFVGLSNFKVDELMVDAANADFRPPELAAKLGNGMWIEVKGTVSNGVLLAEKISGRQSGIEIAATISSVDPDADAGQIVMNATPLQTLVVTVDSTTLTTTGAGRPLRLEEMLPVDFLQIKAQQRGDVLVATHIEHQNDQKMKLKGPIEGVGLAGETEGSDGTGLGTVKLIGITLKTDGDTEFEPKEFFASVKEGDIVKVRDEIEANGVGDGVADRVEIDSRATTDAGDPD